MSPTNRRRPFPIAPALLLALLGSGPAPRDPADARASADPAPAPAPTPAVSEVVDAFESDGRRIAVERFEPAGPGPFPVVLVLHGSTGLELGGPRARDLARALAARGFLTVVPHYFDRTGDRFVALRSQMERRFETWAHTVADATAYAAELPRADPRRVGLVGLSLGAYLSLAVATYDPRVGAVVDYFGGLPDPILDRAEKLPPTLILHGEADRVVPVGEAHKLESLLKGHGVPHEVRLYPGAGHAFDPETAADAERLAADFLARRLGPERTATRADAGRDPSSGDSPGE